MIGRSSVLQRDLKQSFWGLLCQKSSVQVSNQWRRASEIRNLREWVLSVVWSIPPQIAITWASGWAVLVRFEWCDQENCNVPRVSVGVGYRSGSECRKAQDLDCMRRARIVWMCWTRIQVMRRLGCGVRSHHITIVSHTAKTDPDREHSSPLQQISSC
jgi:hypothetical protein